MESEHLSINQKDSEIKFFDAHTHVQFAAYENDAKEVIERALQNGVGMINAGTKKETSLRAVEIANQYESGVYASIALHPIHVSPDAFHDTEEVKENTKEESFDYEWYRNLAKEKKVVAIGECGLDYFHMKDETIKEKQKEVFIQHVKLSHETKKPLVIHSRDAFPDLLEILKSHKELLNPIPGVMHFFTGGKEEAKQFLNLGFYFTFGGVVTFAREYDEVIKMLPLERILSETDAPYVAPAPYRGKRNEPAYIPYIVQKLAEIRGETEEKMSEIILGNVSRVFPSI